MSEHKYNDAYSKGFKAGKKQAFTGYCMQCYDELSPYEQAKLMVEWGADIPNVLDKIRVEIEQAYCKVTNDYDKGRNYGLYMAIEMIDKYRAESENKK